MGWGDLKAAEHQSFITDLAHSVSFQLEVLQLYIALQRAGQTST